jgi:hypothetical protein
MCITKAHVLAHETPPAFTTFSTSGAMENKHFIFLKTPETPNSSLPLKHHRLLQKCQHHHV